MQQRFAYALICACLILTQSVQSAEPKPKPDPRKDALALTAEAITILKDHANTLGTAEDYAACIFKLEKAQAIWESVGEGDLTEGQEAQAALFWAKRFTSPAVIDEVKKLKLADHSLR